MVSRGALNTACSSFFWTFFTIDSTQDEDTILFRFDSMGEKSAKKEKKKRESLGGDGDVVEVKAEFLAAIAKPLCDDKLSKKYVAVLAFMGTTRVVSGGIYTYLGVHGSARCGEPGRRRGASMHEMSSDAVLPRRRGRTESDERGARNDTEAPSSSAYFVSRAGRLVTGVSRSLGLSSHRRLLPRSVLAHSVLPPPCRIYKLVKKSAKEKKVKRGVKECIKAIRKNQKGIMVIAGNISPIDVVTPLPVLCEDNDIPYVFVSSKEALGQAGSTKRPRSCMLVMKGGDDDYDDVLKKVKSVQVAY